MRITTHPVCAVAVRRGFVRGCFRGDGIAATPLTLAVLLDGMRFNGTEAEWFRPAIEIDALAGFTGVCTAGVVSGGAGVTKYA